MATYFVVPSDSEASPRKKRGDPSADASGGQKRSSGDSGKAYTKTFLNSPKLILKFVENWVGHSSDNPKIFCKNLPISFLLISLLSTL